MDNIYNDFKPTLNEIEKSNDQTNKPLTSLLKSDFKLSPHAPAFVPRFSIPSQQQQQQNVQQQQQQQQNIQQFTNYYNDPKYQQNFPDLTNNNNQQYAQQSENNVIELSNEILKEDDYYALNELNNFIENISKNPALYEANIQIETEILNNWILEDPDIIMECVVNNIMDQAIMDNNFRYNGVRFCLHLISNLLVQTSKGSFKEVLLQRCKREHSRRDALSQASDNGLYLRGLTFFIGDLSTKLDEADLKFAVPDLCKTLLKNKTSDNLKCCCQVLKLCGKHLNQFLIDQNQIELIDSLFNELKEIVDKEEVENSVKNLINSTIELYKNNWETPQSSTPLFNPYAKGNCNINQQNPFNNQYNNNQINEYDNQFNPQFDEQLNYDFGPCGDENDEDVCDAFEEFLRQSNQI